MTRSVPGFLPALRAALERRAPVPLEEEGASHAAVAVIVTEEAEASILFVKRRERAGDPWSGHAAFPGGYHSATDDSPAATAERETEEETGLDLARVGRRLGQLDDIYPKSIYLPRIIVTPVVFSVPARLTVSPSAEIESAVWVRVLELLDPANRRPFVLAMPAGTREFESIHAAGLVIWGLTERILAQLPDGA
jgi:8-oxo-dGTP pyrophosphatase MutT (NUDIX family)